MNQTLPAETMETEKHRFILEMLGFSDAEKTMLSSTFRLTGRRSFCYAEPSSEHDRADIYLVNTDNAEAIQQLEKRSPSIHAPAVLIGRTATETASWPLIQKPIHWMRLFGQLDDLMQAALLERNRRTQNINQHWDGQTYRRNIDKKLAPESPIAAPKKPVESVLVVDDSATVRAFMRIKLAPFHFDVDYAENGEQAIAMAEIKKYTCIFLDIMMPGIDGYKVCKHIKANPSTKNTAVVMLSSKSSAFDKFRGAWAGCDTYLGKPVDENDLLATIARFLPSSREMHVGQATLA
ncbi:response regulator [Undibacterium sp. RTI2.1]|uniref:response regulator n=1 Tax=unclassified Undibacterium TaxID=2630295 RepID=UPI002AB3EAE6|nr:MULTISPECIES: response regulator [unclassified Undibacterium]MDY7539179.1 response regulator [Undibacterium sp. 5I1]MEB0031031.1 response regulator [Undibacterium sp. RTI2.1]MEB0116282.1 response regulator [Undibacterium sp. RTI2.2]MEB0231150.1 response regulator [Undibacterium sp. 10I3]MEB0257023.1 response regulator [Undibacterium sp. 5I1]